MIDLRAARNDPDGFRVALARKGAAEVFDELLAADQAVRDIQPRAEELRAARKVKGKPTPEQLKELEGVKEELQQLEQQLAAAEGRRKELLERVPNPPDEGTPDGDSDNVPAITFPRMERASLTPLEKAGDREIGSGPRPF